MALSVSARNAPGKPSGFALIVLHGPDGAVADPRFRISREGYPTANLGTGGWQMETANLSGVLEPVGGETALLVGPTVTRWLEPGPVSFHLAGQRPVPLFWPDDIAPYDGPWPPPDMVVAAPPPPPPPPPAPPATVIAAAPVLPEPAAPDPLPPPPTPAPPEPVRTPWALIGLGVFLLLAAATAGAWWMGWLAPVTCRLAGIDCPAPPPPAPIPAPAPTPTPAPPPSAGWPESSDGLALRDIVGRAPNAQGILDAALRRQAQGRHDDALVLFEEAADRGIAAAMTALARLYDPVDFRRGEPFASPDPRQAARYYREAVRAGDPAAGAARQRLRAWLEQQAAAGNATARDALSEFWP
jgi:hypothetical protein